MIRAPPQIYTLSLHDALPISLEDEDEPRVLLIALRHLAQAQGIAKVAKAAGIERESLYRALSAHGNPRLSTLVAVTKAIGLRLTVEAAQYITAGGLAQETRKRGSDGDTWTGRI